VIADGDLIALRATVRARQVDSYQGIPSTGRTIEVGEMLLVKSSPEGTCQEAWSAFDTMGMAQQLGVVPRKRPPKATVWLMVHMQRTPKSAKGGA
jgi:hypothetical protein